MIKISNNQDFFVTSDTWFGRSQIIQISKRPFSSIDEMNDAITKKWNSVVKSEDIVLHLGNFAWDPHTAERMLKKLNGKIHFILGHEDSALIDAIPTKSLDSMIIHDQIYHMPHHDLVLSHYPLFSWAGKETGTIHIHGHLPYSHKTELFGISNRVNACIDQWNLSPVKISTIKEFLDEGNQTKNLPPISQ